MNAIWNFEVVGNRFSSKTKTISKSYRSLDSLHQPGWTIYPFTGQKIGNKGYSLCNPCVSCIKRCLFRRPPHIALVGLSDYASSSPRDWWIQAGYDRILAYIQYLFWRHIYIYIYTLGAWGSPGTPAPRGFIYMKLGWGWGGVGWDGNVPCTCTHGRCYASHGMGWGWGGDGNVPCTCTHGRCYATSCSLHLHTWSVLRKSWDWGGVGWGW